MLILSRSTLLLLLSLLLLHCYYGCGSGGSCSRTCCYPATADDDAAAAKAVCHLPTVSMKLIFFPATGPEPPFLPRRHRGASGGARLERRRRRPSQGGAGQDRGPPEEGGEGRPGEGLRLCSIKVKGGANVKRSDRIRYIFIGWWRLFSLHLSKCKCALLTLLGSHFSEGA